MIKEKSQRILIIDDSPENIHVLMGLLKDEYKVIAATSGLKGIELAEKAPQPDLVLLDIMMPGIDGYEVCKKLKSSELTEHIPVVFISAMPGSEDNYKGLKIGAIDYFKKPIIPEITKTRIRNHLKLKECQDTLKELSKKQAVRCLNETKVKNGGTEASRILLVEDSEINREIMMNQLKTLGFDVLPATNGLEALQILNEGKCDVVLTDLDMPHMDGFDLAQTIRKTDPSLPVVAITASEHELSKQKAFEFGFAEYIEKPFSNETILNLIKGLHEA